MYLIFLCVSEKLQAEDLFCGVENVKKYEECRLTTVRPRNYIGAVL